MGAGIEGVVRSGGVQVSFSHVMGVQLPKVSWYVGGIPKEDLMLSHLPSIGGFMVLCLSSPNPCSVQYLYHKYCTGSTEYGRGASQYVLKVGILRNFSRK